MGSIRTIESIAKIAKTSTTTLSLPASRINIGASQYVTSALTLNTSVIGVGGVDATIAAVSVYTVYAVVSSNVVYLIASLNSSLPAGFTQARAVGGFSTNASSQIEQVASQAGDLSITGSVSSLGGLSTQDDRNLIINGGFDISQRGAGPWNNPATPPGAYTLDRWLAANAVNGALNYSIITDVPSASKSKQCLRMTVANAGTDGSRQYNAICYRPEGYDAARYIGKVCTLSFWARSSFVGNAGFGIQALGSSYYTKLIPIYQANTWEYKTITFPFSPLSGTPNIDTSAACTFWWALIGGDSGGADGAWTNTGVLFPSVANGRTNWPLNATFDLADVMFNIGTQAAPFQRAGGSIAGELALCQRYYWRDTDYDNAGYAQFIGTTGSATTVRWVCPLPITTRDTNYTVTALNGAFYTIEGGVGSANILSSLTYNKGTNSFMASYTGSGFSFPRLSSLSMRGLVIDNEL